MKQNLIQIRSYDSFDKNDEHYRSVEKFVYNHQLDDGKPIFKIGHKGKIVVQNFVGIVPIDDNIVLEILPKIPLFDSPESDNTQKEKDVFYKMLQHFRGKEMPEFPPTVINKVKNFDMLEVFKLMFLNQTLNLVKRGITSDYHTQIGNLPYLKGRLQFPHHTVINAANAAGFYTEYDVYSPNNPANRLIHKALLSLACTQSDNQQLCRELLRWFADIPASTHIEKDWDNHKLDKNMQHYYDVMRWVGLLLFNQGLTTFVGEYQNKSLLFPMEKLFEDYVSYWIKKEVQSHYVKTQSPQKDLLKNDNNKEFSRMKPDIALINKNSRNENSKNENVVADYILDCKWKPMLYKDNKQDESEADLYQLFTYGKMYECNKVMLIYPKNHNFTKPLFRTFNEKNQLELISFPFDLAKPKESAKNIAEICKGYN